MEVAKALGGSFKLVTLALKTVREITQLPRETQKNGDTNKSLLREIKTGKTYPQRKSERDNKAVRLDFESTALRPFDDLLYDRRPTYRWAAAALRPK